MSSIHAAPIVTVRQRTVSGVLLSRRGLVYPPPDAPFVADAARDSDAVPDAQAQLSSGLVMLEFDLLDRGLLLSAALRDRLSRLDVATMTRVGTTLLADIDATLGADRDMRPQFRGFPDSVPADTVELWVDRTLTWLFQNPEQPCVLCGTEGVVHAVSPCAHLVCHTCFDGSDYSGCPICHRRIDPDDPFLRPAKAHGRQLEAVRRLPARARLLGVGDDAERDGRGEVAALLARPGALSPQDRDDLLVLLDTCGRDDLEWLPDTIPGRETKALVLAWLLADREAWPRLLPTVTDRMDTATDVLRLIVAFGGADAGLIAVPHLPALPRPLRRALLAALDRLDPHSVAEDLRRHRRLWIHAAERLHPFEHARAYPQAAVAFAALRGTRLTDDRLSQSLRETAVEVGLADSHAESRVDGPQAAPVGRIVARSFAGRVERHLADGDLPAAVALLAKRPGELLRRLDHLLRLAGTQSPEAVLAALPKAVPHVSSAVLLATLGALRTRTTPHGERVFFPKGGTASTHIIDDARPPLAEAVVAEATALLTGEVLARCGRLPRVGHAVIDAALDDVIAPFTQRTASRALVTLPRGSGVETPRGRHLRLFLHWTEDKVEVDLDLSVALFTEAWEHCGTCDYTSLRWRDDAAVHSGDFTSAPPPDGSTEFLDLDVQALREAGAHYAVAAIFSFNNVAFDDMAEAFAGLMIRDDPSAGEVFDPRTVEQRFDLAGRAKASLPLMIDLEAGVMRWLDVVQGVTGTHHAVHLHQDKMALVARAMDGLFGSGARISLGELARWHAAARAATVAVRGCDGSTAHFVRGESETVADFARRLDAGTADRIDAARAGENRVDEDRGDPAGADGVPADLGFVYRGDCAMADGAQVYALHPANLAADRVDLLAAADVAGLLVPVGETD